MIYKRIGHQLFWIILIFSYSTQSYAYLDPGTGSMLIQMIIGGVVAALFTIKMYWYQFKTYIKRKLGYADDDASDDLNTSDINEE